MANYCLMPQAVTKFKQALKDGTLDPEKLSKMTSAERNELFAKFVGSNNAKAVNSEFESKILLKNQQQGYLTWAKHVTGIKPAARRDLIAKIERMQKVLDPEDGEQFMHDLTATRLGVDVTEHEAKNIANYSKAITEAQEVRLPDKSWPSEQTKMKYGYLVEDLTQYVHGLKNEAKILHLKDVRPKNAGQIALKAAGNMKALRASLDNSSLFRQAFKLLLTHPGVWAKNAAKSFSNAARTVGGKNVMRDVNAEIISRPNYDKYVRGKLATATTEEAYPESLAEKVPALGRLYKASETAFTAMLHKSRADLFDKMLAQAEKKGVNINDTEELKAIANLCNTLTGRGNIGQLEKNAALINNFFFSPRLLKSNLDVILQPLGRGGATTKFARAEARKNFIRMVGGTFGLLAAADAIYPGGVEWDPRSSDFGKLRIGDTRIDLTGGAASLITLLARIKSGQSKSSSTGKITSLTSGKFGEPNRLDMVVSFFLNKASPAASIGIDKLKGHGFNYQKFNWGREAVNSVTPLSAETYLELKQDPRAINTLAGMIADALGLSTNTYSASGGGTGSLYDLFNKNVGTSWSQSSSKKLAQFKKVKGQQKFNKAARQFDASYNSWINAVRKNPVYEKLSTDDKAKLIKKKKRQLKKTIFDEYNFDYQRQDSAKINKNLL